MLEALQARLGHTFSNVNLLEQAVTHRSYLNEHDDYPLGHNERLEYLGDAVLELIASEMLFVRFPNMTEGYMTRLRAWLVRTETLADFAIRLELGRVLRMARGEEDNGGRERETNLCNAFEAVVGALYLDAGLDLVRRLVVPFFEPVLEDVLVGQKDKDPKSMFQEWSQEVFSITPTYRLVATIQDDDTQSFTVEALLGNVAVGWGNGRNKQLAEQAAALQALEEGQAGLLVVTDTADPVSD